MTDYEMLITALFLVALYFLYWATKSDAEKADVIKEINKKSLCTGCGTYAERRYDHYWCRLCHNEFH